ncbi:hypothetical protein ACMG4P_04810 [Pseudovibrio denitrificans]|uniref:hypothetical protein n=1 Tax=Pseudovibrio denitrificans TaxID=258256 RepID=UPI0039BFD761
MSTTRTIVDELGRTQLQEKLGVKSSAISMAVLKGVFPAAWFDVLDTLGQAKGVQIPRALFNWKRCVKKEEEGDCVSPL